MPFLKFFNQVYFNIFPEYGNNNILKNGDILSAKVVPGPLIFLYLNWISCIDCVIIGQSWRTWQYKGFIATLVYLLSDFANYYSFIVYPSMKLHFFPVYKEIFNRDSLLKSKRMMDHNIYNEIFQGPKIFYVNTMFSSERTQL